MIKAVIFDCFGVLISGVMEGIVRELQAEGRDADAEEVHSLMHVADKGIITLDEQMERLSQLLDKPVEELWQRLEVGEVPNEELMQYIESLRSRYKTALMSNIAGRRRISIRLPDGMLDKLFDVVVLSGEIGHVKPEPEIYDITLQKLGVAANEAVFTDDLEINCHAAEELGIRSIQFFTAGQFKQEFEALEAELNGN